MSCNESMLNFKQVLITKLRSANTAETRQYRKASKALLVLIPLFGLTYLIVLYGPNEGMGKKMFDIARALLLSTQVFYWKTFYIIEGWILIVSFIQSLSIKQQSQHVTLAVNYDAMNKIESFIKI